MYRIPTSQGSLILDAFADSAFVKMILKPSQAKQDLDVAPSKC